MSHQSEDGPARDDAGLAYLAFQTSRHYAVLTIDLVGAITTWNPAAQRVLGWSAAEAVGADAAMIFTPEDRAREVPSQEMAAAREKGFAEDLRWHVRRDGSRFWASGEISPLIVDGRHIGYAKILRDRTADRLMSDRIAAEGERLRQMFDQAPSFMAVLRGPDHRFELTNAAYLQLIGHRDVIGRPVRAALPELEGQGFFELLDRVYASGEPFVGSGLPISIQREAGGPPHQRYLNFVYQPLYGDDGAVSGIFAEGFDVTDLVRAEAALRESEARLELAAEASGLGVWEWRLDANEMIYSERAKAIYGFPAGQPVTYEMVVGVTHPDDFVWTSAQAARAFDPQIRDASPYEYRIITSWGEQRWVLAAGRVVFETGASGEARATRYVGATIDITARKAMEEEIRASEARVRLAIEAGRMGLWHFDPAAGGVQHSVELNRILGFPDDARPNLEEIRLGYGPGEGARVRAAAQAAEQSGERFFEVEFQYRGPDARARWLLIRAEVRQPLGEGEAFAIGVLMDVTERKQAEDRLRLLTREVDHRANNLLTVVQATAALTDAGTVAEFKAKMSGRIAALAHAHQLLAEARWGGADLRRLVEEEVSAFAEDGRIAISGPNYALRPAAAQAIAMALHELATNAVKHGALSVKAGRVDIVWTVDPATGDLTLRWTECGGPPVVPPARRGLGATILARALQGPLAGATDIRWEPGGVVCELRLPGQAAAPG